MKDKEQVLDLVVATITDKTTGESQTRAQIIIGSLILEMPTDKGVILSMIKRYVDRDDDLNRMEMAHFQNWCISWYNARHQSDVLEVRILQGTMKQIQDFMRTNKQ